MLLFPWFLSEWPDIGVKSRPIFPTEVAQKAIYTWNCAPQNQQFSDQDLPLFGRLFEDHSFARFGQDSNPSSRDYPFNFRPPTFKHVTPTSRTNARQLLLREKCLQEEQQQRQRQQRWRQDATSIKTQTVVASATTTTSSLTPTPAISIKRPSEEALNSSKIPAEVLKVIFGRFLISFWPFSDLFFRLWKLPCQNIVELHPLAHHTSPPTLGGLKSNLK